jgi:putative membrane protein
MTLAHTAFLADTWGMHGDIGWGWMALMMVLMVLFWAAIIVGVVWLIRAAFDRRPGPRSESPTEVLERRFAEGAISVEDYRERREVLGNGNREPKGAHEDELLTAPRVAEGRQ